VSILLKSLLTFHGITQEELALSLGRSQAYVSYILTGLYMPRESEAEIICGKVNAVVSDIFPNVRANRND